jgi:8-amino-3,8-dideoxy-alpha-D-manno-octulosonate transaminase
MPGFELIGKEEKKNILDIFEKSNGVMFAHGFEKLRNNIFRVREFEKQLKNKFNTKECQVVSSGTAAIKVALKAIGIKPGDEVITQSFNFIATIEAILDCGAKPIITKIDDSLNMCPIDLKKRITSKTKAIIPVHMLGFSVNLKEIIKICKKSKIFMIEDNCEAVGGKYHNKYLGTIGDAGILSFDHGKNITTGEGGAILTNNKKIFVSAKEYHDHGHQLNPKFPRGMDTVKMAGFNYRMSELNAAVGLAQIKKINFILKENKKRYLMLHNIVSKKFKIRKCHINTTPSFDTFIFKVDNLKLRKKIVRLLKSKKIGTKNLPDAIKWHFASYWKHAISKKEINRLEESHNKLKKHIAIPILLKKNINSYKEVANKIIEY